MVQANTDQQVFEQSRFARETGAAVHIAPNANGVLKRLGVHAEDIEANKMERVCRTITMFRLITLTIFFSLPNTTHRACFSDRSI